MKYLKSFNENIEIDWDKPYRDQKVVLDELNRIYKKTLSGVGRLVFQNSDLEWSDTPRKEYEYKDGKLIKTGENNVYLKLSKSVKEELEELLYIEEIYDRLKCRFEDVVDDCNYEVNIFLKWVYSPKFKDESELKLLADFNFINIDLLSLSESIQLIVKIIGNKNIEEWSLSSEEENSKTLSVYFKVKK